MLLGVRGKIGMAAFGRDDLVALAVPNKERFAETGACSEQAARAAGFGFAVVQHTKLFWVEIFDAVTPSAEVVEQNDVLNIQFLGKDGGINHPGKIGGADAIVNDRAGDTEARGFDFFSRKMRGSLARELFGDQIKLCEVLAAKALPKNGDEFAVFFGKQREIALGTTDIARKDQRRSPEEIETD